LGKTQSTATVDVDSSNITIFIRCTHCNICLYTELKQSCERSTHFICSVITIRYFINLPAKPSLSRSPRAATVVPNREPWFLPSIFCALLNNVDWKISKKHLVKNMGGYY
jgi:hypothetical protein